MATCGRKIMAVVPARVVPAASTAEAMDGDAADD